jgi:transposase InsO family protein
MISAGAPTLTTGCYGRVFQNIQDVRSAVAAFINKYNQQWLVGKLGYRSPAQARREYFQAIAA